jgi:hypothetical protein
MSSRDYIPQDVDRFKPWADNFMNVLNKIANSQVKFPDDRITELQKAQSVFDNAFLATEGQHTPAQRLARVEAQAEFTRLIREFVNEYLRFARAVTDVMRKELGITIRDTIRTVHKVVNETVDFVIHVRGTNNLIIDFWQTGRHPSKAKPRGYDGAVLIWAFSENEPISNEHYTHHTLCSRTPYTIEFDTHDSGRRVWIRMCWQNARGILGRYSEAKSAIVP